LRWSGHIAEAHLHQFVLLLRAGKVQCRLAILIKGINGRAVPQQRLWRRQRLGWRGLRTTWCVHASEQTPASITATNYRMWWMYQARRHSPSQWRRRSQAQRPNGGETAHPRYLARWHPLVACARHWNHQTAEAAQVGQLVAENAGGFTCVCGAMNASASAIASASASASASGYVGVYTCEWEWEWECLRVSACVCHCECQCARGFVWIRVNLRMACVTCACVIV